MNIGLIDVDGKFPNLALMRISSYYKSIGHQCDWYNALDHYDAVYISKVFSFTDDVLEPANADQVFRGGTGYCITAINGKEVWDNSKNVSLPKEIESCKPDYSIYPQCDFAVAMTTRGCPRQCSFCIVGKKEGICATKVGEVCDFWNGQKKIEVLDPNITACKDKHYLFQEYSKTKAKINFNQGIDIRLLTEDDIHDLNQINLDSIHFAWDNPKDNLVKYFEQYAKFGNKMKSDKRYFGIVYTLVNFNSTMEENLFRIYKLKELGFLPYVMIYDKEHASSEIKNLQRWCNNRFIYQVTPRFEDYNIKEDTNQIKLF